MAKDPVCGMRVTPENAADKKTYMGKTFYFCSRKCSDEFMKSPEYHLATQFDKKISNSRKIAVVGTGQVGATFAFALMTSSLSSEIVLIDADHELAVGHAMDLNHGLPFAEPTKIHPGNYEDCRGADIVVITAGAAQKPGETRLDLVKKNAEIFKSMIPEIVKHEPGLLLIVSNPVDILTYVALKVSGYPMNRVIGSGTVLDTARFRFLLSRHCNVDARNVQAFVIGEHGDTELPVWSQVHIAGMPFSDYCPMCHMNCTDDDKQLLFAQVKRAAYEIIDRKGYTNFAIALGLTRILSAILRDENSALSVSSLIDNYYGISDVCLSIPSILNRNGIYRHLNMALDQDEVGMLRGSAGVLKEVLGQLDI